MKEKVRFLGLDVHAETIAVAEATLARRLELPNQQKSQK